MIDFHCHLDLYENPKEMVEKVRSSGAYVLSVTTTPKAFLGTKKLAEGNERIQTALGFHPQVVHERENELQLIDLLIPQVRFVGEIGLDGSSDYRAHLGVQKKVFRHILNACASSGGRVMSIHSRSAATCVLDILEEFPGAGTPVLHWFSGSKVELKRAIEMGAWFSVGPAMMRSMKARELVSMMPHDRVLTETDGPFAKIRGKTLCPGDVQIGVFDISDAWGREFGDVGKQIVSNFKSLCSLADSYGRAFELLAIPPDKI